MCVGFKEAKAASGELDRAGVVVVEEEERKSLNCVRFLVTTYGLMVDSSTGTVGRADLGWSSQQHST